MANRHKSSKKQSHEAHSAEIEREAGLKRGGRTKPHRATGGSVPGFKSGGRLDKRARGGGVGADKHPFSSAHFSK